MNDDIILRKAAMNAFAGKPHEDYICSVLKELPAVDKPPMGQWTDKQVRHLYISEHAVWLIAKCSICKKNFVRECYVPEEWRNYFYKFCPNCGAKMVVEQEDT